MSSIDRRTYEETTRPMLEKAPAKKIVPVIAVTSVSIGTFCAGSVLCWTSPALTHIEIPQNLTENSSPGFTVNASEGAFIASMLTIGALVAAIPIGFCADRFGRKLTVIFLAVMFLMNWILITFAANFTTVLLARFLAGVGLGGICVVAPIYIGEITEPSYRGFFSSFLQLGLAGGVFFTCLIGSLTNWIGLSAILAITPILLGLSFAFMPESPVFLVSKNKKKQAEKSLRRLRGSSYDISDEMSSIERSLIQTTKSKVTITEALTNRGYMRALVSAVGILIFQQFSGINAIVFYTVTIFKEAGTNISPFLAAVIVNSVQLLASIFQIMIAERAGRRHFLIISSLGMMTSLIGLGIFFQLKLIMKNTTFLAFIPLSSTVLFMTFFVLGYGPIPWMLLGELFAPEIKGFASGVSILVNWSSAFIVTFSFPLISSTYGSYTSFYILGGLMGLATLFVYFIVPETRGKTLQEIQEELNR